MERGNVDNNREISYTNCNYGTGGYLCGNLRKYIGWNNILIYMAIICFLKVNFQCGLILGQFLMQLCIPPTVPINGLDLLTYLTE